MHLKFRRLSEIALFSAVFFLPFSKMLLELFVIISIVSWLIYQFLSRGRFSENKTFLVLLILFWCSSSVSLFNSGYLFQSIRGLAKIVKYGFFALTAADLFSQNHKNYGRLINILIVSLSLVIADSLFQRFTGWELLQRHAEYTGSQIRLSGPFSSYGLLAAFLIAALLGLFGYLAASKGRRNFEKACSIVLLAAGCFVLFSTHSRGAWLAFVISLIIFLTMLKRKKMALVALVGTILFFLLLPRSILIHPDLEGKERAILDRYYLWRRAIYVIQDKPFFGCGINTYVLNYPKYDKIQSSRVSGYYAHNGYLQMAAETGLISLGIFLCLIGIAVREGYKGALKLPNPGDRLLIFGFVAGFIALLLHASIDTTLHNLQSATLIWMYLGILVGAGNFKVR
ncbi:MAG: hypothetical protein A3G33_06225 [Omnitrophica bacterium RIFCSPLOWO2_12_FULL_44_17]|uniref:O-antigen ligase-related domain-containing protein n=1 Tax=Candidatus Danuiimicrobium aquiferis TaxID=1801832 RepID=A0A1G1KVG7_9BACT|nr:MAG: hypothetical protein A3B72_04770 [Omnitrophica bacterium RIFCSPHIGHO2_02_FULL_45_28]OGW88700.1 MAG: hypothetical protein A3E74_09550 [Omnitrophica bacterium RIFCSPHIGHO2_12_FULL_44_12]OGW96880.1 MAG: hypothetical protein A3G33_06225 [Omnitrophica bacterium RIFCSPLOWO2_12_FULL_44_17]OGX02413.1 MAG: hypothetical protein A3J12_04970 [Omnitrophica bacterium RIFCSPLOWO2_02_FULL_44_11]